MTARACWATPGLVLSLAAGVASAQDGAPLKATSPATVAADADAPAGPGAAAATADDVQDLIFFGGEQPLFLRMHIVVDGKGFQSLWMDAIRRLHKYTDGDGDGRLSAAERARGTMLSRLVAPPRTGAMSRQGRAGASETSPAAGPADDVVTADDLANYLRPYFGPMQLQLVGPGVNKPELLFNSLDADGDKTLGRAELEAAESSLRKVDRDDDGTIQLAELQPHQNPFFGRVAEDVSTPSAGDSPFVLLAPSGPRSKLVRRLLVRYDRPDKDTKLSRTELGLEPSAFDGSDRDGDGVLDFDEIAHLLDHLPPHLELAVRVARNGPTRIEVIRRGPGLAPSTPGVQTRETASGGLALVLETVQLELSPGGRGGQPEARQFYQSQFNRADADNNKYLEMKEAARSGVFDTETFRLMDRDGDGKLFEKEMNEVIAQESDMSEARTMLSVVDQGRSLYNVVDANRDRRLSVREIAGILAKVDASDRDGDGRITATEIPHHYLLGFGRGRSMLLSRFGFTTGVEGMGSPVAPPKGKQPTWFGKMDRNLDGDVSRREFLGARPDFDRLDTDRNGLLDGEEAAKAR